MISPQAPVVDSNGKITPVWFRWLSELRGNADAGASQADMDAAIAAIATALGSPDGTVANIPQQDDATIRLLQGAGIAITGDAENGYAIAIRPLSDSGTGALRGITRDAYGRVSGTTDATITGTAGQIDVANGDAAAGPPTLSLADVADAGGGTLQKTAFDAKGRKTGTSAATTGDLAEGTNLYHTDERAQAAVVAAAITPGDTTHAPSGDAVDTALGAKYDKAGGTVSGDMAVLGNLTVGTTAGGAVYEILRPGTSSAGSKIQFSGPGGVPGFVGVTGAASRCDVRFGANVLQLCVSASVSTPTVQVEVLPTSLRFGADNAYTFGDAGRRCKEIFSANSVINTSDAREKTPLRTLDDAELAIARDLAGIVGIYQWLAAIAEKGEDGARLHCGAIAQEVIAAFEAHGRDAFRYGIACYDAWPETREPAQYETVEVRPAQTIDHPAIYERTQVYTAEGMPERFAERLVAPAWTEVVAPAVTEQRLVSDEVIHPAGNRYSLRYGELSMFLIAGQEARLRALEARA